MSDSSQDELTGQLLDNRYQIEKKIGHGGMCFVYLAHDTVAGEKVAIKILLPALVNDRTAMARLRREAALGRRLAHPNVCHIIRIGGTPADFDYHGQHPPSVSCRRDSLRHKGFWLDGYSRSDGTTVLFHLLAVGASQRRVSISRS